MLMRTLAFLGLFAALQGLYSLGQGGWIEKLVIDVGTVRTAAWIIGLLDPGIVVQATGSMLRSPGGSINVLNGCEGIEFVFLLAAAMLVAPMRWRGRLAGVACGAALIFLLNQVRVVALFYAFRSDRAWFDMLHGVLTPLLMVVATGGFFAFWLSRHPAHRQDTQAGAA